MELITQRFSLEDIYPDKVRAFSKRYGIKPNNLMLVRKGKVAESQEIIGEERAVVSYITTDRVDRDREIVHPEGAILDDYRKNPVVLWAHNYRGLPIGKNIWIKSDKRGLKAKTIFASYEFADQVYILYQGEFLRAWSIGFVPVDFKEGSEDSDIRGEYNEWVLLEYSAVPVPSNPDAITVAVSKGIITSEKLKKYFAIGKKIDPHRKPEETEDYIRIPVPEEEGKHEGHKIRTITISKKQGIKALYCVDCKVIITYLFDKSCKHKPNKCDWTMEEAQAWMREHSKKQSFICECIDCGYVTETDKHCKDLKCPECGGQMRRIERPGAGQDSYEVEVIENELMWREYEEIVKELEKRGEL